MRKSSTVRLLLAALIATAAFTTGASRVEAAPRLKVLICHPGGPGSTEEAIPRLARFFRRVETLAGWAEGSVTATYLNSADACDLYLKDEKPHLAILGLSAFLARGEEMHAQPLLEVVPTGAESERYHVVVESDPATDLAGLKGKVLAGELLSDPSFVTKVIFQGAFDAGSDVQPKRCRTPLRAIKLVHRGKVAAALLDEATFQSLKTLPFGDQLREVFVSEPIPGWPVVALGNAKPGDRLAPGDRKALLAALPKVCEGPDAKEICEPVRLGGFRPVTPTTYEATKKAFQK